MTVLEKSDVLMVVLGIAVGLSGPMLLTRLKAWWVDLRKGAVAKGQRAQFEAGYQYAAGKLLGEHPSEYAPPELGRLRYNAKLLGNDDHYAKGVLQACNDWDTTQAHLTNLMQMHEAYKQTVQVNLERLEGLLTEAGERINNYSKSNVLMENFIELCSQSDGLLRDGTNLSNRAIEVLTRAVWGDSVKDVRVFSLSPEQQAHMDAGLEQVKLSAAQEEWNTGMTPGLLTGDAEYSNMVHQKLREEERNLSQNGTPREGSVN